LLDEARALLPGHIEQPDSRTLRFVPDVALAPHARYVPLVAQPGFARPAFSEYRFTTGESTDETPPTFGVNANSIDVVSQALPASCGAAPGTYGVTVDFAAATDNADSSAIEYSLLLTRAVGVDQAVVLDQSRQNQAGGVELLFRLSKEQVQKPVCIALRAVDGVGLLADNQPALCFHPIQGSYFEPYCAVRNVGQAGRAGTPGTRRPSDSAWAFLVAFGLLCLRRVRAGERRTAGQPSAGRNQRGW
jgi:hypothetical protein